MYSTLCGEMASRGYIVVACEHRDGTGPSTVVRLLARGDFPFLDHASHFLLLGLVLLIATAAFR